MEGDSFHVSTENPGPGPIPAAETPLAPLPAGLCHRLVCPGGQLGFGQMHRLKTADLPDWVDQQIIPVNGAARRGETMRRVTDIAIHYVGNPGTSAQANRNYFAQPDTQVSAHFLIGLEGEIIQCIPLNEKSSATNDRNRDTISIEVCHPDATGQFTQASYDALVKLTAWLCDTAGIGRDQVIRHYDVTEKLCPLYYVEHPEAWDAFRADVAAEMERQTEVS